MPDILSAWLIVSGALAELGGRAMAQLIKKWCANCESKQMGVLVRAIVWGVPAMWTCGKCKRVYDA